jgi:hypothetical protein
MGTLSAILTHITKMEIINSILLIAINLFIMKFLLKRNLNNLGYALIPVCIFIFINLLFGDFSHKLIPIILLYSLALIILSYISSWIDVTKNSKANVSEEFKIKFRKFKLFTVNIIMPIGITFFQIILVWNKEMQSRI